MRLAAGDFDGYDEVFMLLDDTDDYLGDVEVRPAARCLTVSFRGTHGQAAPRYERLLDYMHERDLSPAGPSRNCPHRRHHQRRPRGVCDEDRDTGPLITTIYRAIPSIYLNPN